MTAHLVTLLFLLLLAACTAGEEAAPTLSGSNPATAAPAPPTPDATLISLGEDVYSEACASCHGANLEGEPGWKQPNPDNSFRAPPHDATGHTWHHGDRVLREAVLQGGERLGKFGISNMPAYAGTLSELEIEAVLTYINSTWPEEIRSMQWERTLTDPGP